MASIHDIVQQAVVLLKAAEPSYKSHITYRELRSDKSIEEIEPSGPWKTTTRQFQIFADVPINDEFLTGSYVDEVTPIHVVLRYGVTAGKEAFKERASMASDDISQVKYAFMRPPALNLWSSIAIFNDIQFVRARPLYSVPGLLKVEFARATFNVFYKVCKA